MKHLIMAATAAALIVSGCGKEDDGYVYKTDLVELTAAPETRSDFDLTEATYLSMTWIHQCPESPVQLPAQRPGHLVIEGPGPHRILRERLLNTDIIFKGRICAPRHYNRDIVIGVDVSSSAYWNDKPVNGTCKRLNAVNAILDSLPTDAKMGLFTFGEEIPDTTQGLVATKAALVSQIAPSGNTMVSRICGPSDTGGSDFNVAMRKARDLLKSGRADGAKKELYVISDGFGSSIFPLQEAEQIATELATTGVVVNGESLPASISGAKIAYNGNPGVASFLEKIITKDSANQNLMQPVDQAIKLANEVSKFAFNDWSDANLVHGVTGSATTKTENLKPLFNSTYEFTIPTFKFDLDLVQTGHTVKINIKDTHGLTKTQEIKFVWFD